MAKGLEEFSPIFGTPTPEWENPSLNNTSPPFLPFLSHIHPFHTYSLQFQITDFHSHTWQSTLSIQQLNNMREDIGVGGSWFEFVEFLRDSLMSEDVRVVFGSGGSSAKLVAQKAKGMPRISIRMERVVDVNASHAMANLSFGLFKALKSGGKSAVKEEEERGHPLRKELFAEQTKGEGTRDQLDAAPIPSKPKIQKLSSPDKALAASSISSLDMMSVSDKHESPKKTTQDHRSKAVKRPVPAYRRAKVRGAVLGDSEDGDEN